MATNESKCFYEARAVTCPLLRDVENRTIFQDTSGAHTDKHTHAGRTGADRSECRSTLTICKKKNRQRHSVRHLKSIYKKNSKVLVKDKIYKSNVYCR